jgi:hypothetical protein
MNFYFSLFQLIETVERMDREVKHLVGRVLRISPRDARANRELLDQCDAKIGEVKNLLNNKAHISKITLRKAAILYQILNVLHQRVLHLAGATSYIGHDDEGSVKATWQMLSMAERHFRTLVKTLHDITGMALQLPMEGAQEPPADLATIIAKEASYQQEALKLLEKATEVFGEDQVLSAQLSQVRKELLESRKRMKHLPASLAHEKAEPPAASMA